MSKKSVSGESSCSKESVENQEKKNDEKDENICYEEMLNDADEENISTKNADADLVSSVAKNKK
jgi:hypothetical protein